jgi:hypothetical protein
MGNDIVFGEGNYSTSSLESMNLMVHELVHVVQQRNHTVQPRLHLKPKTSGKQAKAKEKVNDEQEFEQSYIANIIRTNIIKEKEIVFIEKNGKAIREEKILIDPEKVIKILKASPKFLQAAAKAEKQEPNLDIRFHKDPNVGSHFIKEKSLIEIEIELDKLAKALQTIVHEVIHASHESSKISEKKKGLGSLTQETWKYVREEVQTRKEEIEVMKEITESDIWKNLTLNAPAISSSVKPEEVRTDLKSGLPCLTNEEFAIIDSMNKKYKVAKMSEQKEKDATEVAKAILEEGDFPVDVSFMAKFTLKVDDRQEKTSMSIPTKPPNSVEEIEDMVNKICEKVGPVQGDKILYMLAVGQEPQIDINIPDEIKSFFKKCSGYFRCPSPGTQETSPSPMVKYGFQLKSQQDDYDSARATVNASKKFIFWHSTFDKESRINAVKYLEWELIAEAMSKEWLKITEKNQNKEKDYLLLIEKQRKFLSKRIGKNLAGIEKAIDK